ncbi:hypothetical protein KR074_003546, partial [Drosophila pseudoananassae]
EPMYREGSFYHTGKWKRRKSCKLRFSSERLWEPSYLKAKCKELGLEEEYLRYQIRLMISYLRVFFVLNIIVTALHCFVIIVFTNYKHSLIVDLPFFLVPSAAILLCLSINFFEQFVLRHRWVMTASSIAATIISVSAGKSKQLRQNHVIIKSLLDIGKCAFHYNWTLNNTFDTYNLCMIYMFLPITSFVLAVSLGSLVSLAYILYFLYCMAYMRFYSGDKDFGLATVDVFHYLCFNMLGMFFRMMNDALVRSSFLDRHQFMMEELWLRNARRQESMLLNSILPPQIAKSLQKSIKERIIDTDNGLMFQRSRVHFSSLMAIQIHPDVSILYADVVNYTYLTTTLTVEKLVQVLHDLYARFDMAASMYKVQRIKFLGDCYYCVAGLSEPDPDHALCAVSLGIAMIANIQEVRKKQELNIDMRIGVHSGNLFAGVIGVAKLQLDIWGPDVDIANHLESTGEPGFVHVSGRTLASLNADDYIVIPGTDKAQRDPVLQKHPMSTYLITGAAPSDSCRRTRQSHLASMLDIQTRPKYHSRSSKQMSTTDELQQEFRNMPVGGFDFSCLSRKDNRDQNRKDLGVFCAAFRDSRLEWDFLRRPDYMLKYSIVMAWLIGNCLVFIQIVTNQRNCHTCIVVDIFAFFYLTTLVCISWYKKYCHWMYRNDEERRYGRLSCIIFKFFEGIQQSMSRRLLIYLSIIAIYFSVIVLIVINCDAGVFQLNFIESKLYRYEVNRDVCFHPWAFTNMMALILGMSYTFTRISFSLKMIISLVEVVVYFMFLFLQFTYVFHHSVTTSPYLIAEVAHSTRIFVTFVTFYLKERQVEFNTKTNFKLNIDLKNKQQAADITNQSILILLNNLLPSHVVAVYLTNIAKHQLYYENYDMVSVMFASLINFQMDLPSLRVLNNIVTEFDKLLTVYKEYFVVEKIKVVGCTYMAACGLDFNLVKKTRLSRSVTLSGSVRSEVYHDEVVLVMATFALDLMRTLSVCNETYAGLPTDRDLSSGEICIGISSGEIMAGVVGASQPHYDIWGNPVNLASRMQSTGLAGHIQVTEESANILSDYGISSTFRGMTFVKGVGEIPTYFVDISNGYQFIFIPGPQLNRRGSTLDPFLADSRSAEEEEET